MAAPERDGYVYIGSVSVDSASLIIGDPDYLLRWGDEDPHLLLKPTTKDVDDVLAESCVGVIEDSVAVAFRSGYGDGTYPVFAKFDHNGRVVEVVVDMQMTRFHKALFGVKDEQE